MITLYSLLFEEAEQWNPNNLALAVIRNVKFVLYDTAKLRATDEMHNQPNIKDLVAAYILVTPPRSGNCSGAASVALAARNPAYPGAGIMLYKLVSSALNKPITSDRENSTSDDAKAMWKKIEDVGKSGFTRLPLDNYYQGMGADNIYFTVNPDGTVKDGAGPLTPDTSDDCEAPGIDPRDVGQNLGEPDAFQAAGGIAQPFIQRHQEQLAFVEERFGWNTKKFESELEAAGGVLFSTQYRH